MIEFHGDSTQFGAIVTNGLPIVYQSEMLPSDIVGHLLGVPTQNFGVSSTTLRGALTGTFLPGGRNFAQHIAMSSASVIVANWGINDCRILGLSPAQHKSDWETARDICHAAGKALIIETPNPIVLSEQPALVQNTNAVKTISNVGISDMMAHVLGYFEDWRNNIDVAGVHPNERLYTWIGVRLAQDIKRILNL